MVIHTQRICCQPSLAGAFLGGVCMGSFPQSKDMHSIYGESLASIQTCSYVFTGLEIRARIMVLNRNECLVFRQLCGCVSHSCVKLRCVNFRGCQQNRKTPSPSLTAKSTSFIRIQFNSALFIEYQITRVCSICSTVKLKDGTTPPLCAHRIGVFMQLILHNFRRIKFIHIELYRV